MTNGARSRLLPPDKRFLQILFSDRARLLFDSSSFRRAPPRLPPSSSMTNVVNCPLSLTGRCLKPVLGAALATAKRSLALLDLPLGLVNLGKNMASNSFSLKSDDESFVRSWAFDFDFADDSQDTKLWLSLDESTVIVAFRPEVVNAGARLLAPEDDVGFPAGCDDAPALKIS